MATNFVELIGKLQAQTLEGLKQIQAVQVATLTTTREIVASLPQLAASLPTAEGMPTVQQLTELNTNFASQVLEQQKTYASQLAEIFTPVVKTSIN